jgi:hypothetical protein
VLPGFGDIAFGFKPDHSFTGRSAGNFRVVVKRGRFHVTIEEEYNPITHPIHPKALIRLSGHGEPPCNIARINSDVRLDHEKTGNTFGPVFGDRLFAPFSAQAPFRNVVRVIESAPFEKSPFHVINRIEIVGLLHWTHPICLVVLIPVPWVIYSAIFTAISMPDYCCCILFLNTGI